MGALDMGLTKQELRPLVDTWRAANPAITELWWAVDAAAIEAVQAKTTTHTHGLTFAVEGGVLFITLFTGRRLAYVSPRVEPGKFGRDQLFYDGMDQTKNKWTTLDTFGGKLVENLCQAVARDCLAFALTNLQNAGYTTVMHVHDEAIVDASAEDPDKTLADIIRIMSKSPEWAADLPTPADGYYCHFYKKE